jgi:hypothetical protein
MSLISDWLGYLAWRRGRTMSAVRRALALRANDAAWKRRCGVSLSKNTVTNLLRGRTREWHEDSRAFVERVLSEDFGVDSGGDEGFELFADTIGSGLLPPPGDADVGRRERIRDYVGLYHLLRQSTSNARFNADLFLIVPVGEHALRAVLFVGRQDEEGLIPRYVGNLQPGSEALYALMVGRSRPGNVRYRSLTLRLHRNFRVIPGMMLQLSDATAAPTALPIILKRQAPEPQVDPNDEAFSLRALRALVLSHERVAPQAGEGALKPAQKRYLERFTPDVEEALNLFS